MLNEQSQLSRNSIKFKMYKVNWQLLESFDLNSLLSVVKYKSVGFSLYLLLRAASLMFILLKKEMGSKDSMFLIQL